MRFKLDENLSRSVSELFHAAGHDALTVREQGLRGAPDEGVFNVSAREDRVLITLDRDLGQVLRFPLEASAGIVIIEVGPRASHRTLIEWTRELLAILEAQSPERALWIVEPGRLRIHLTKGEE
jgi:predicted nuclease of predicted toxin-antitoxin system